MRGQPFLRLYGKFSGCSADIMRTAVPISVIVSTPLKRIIPIDHKKGVWKKYGFLFPLSLEVLVPFLHTKKGLKSFEIKPSLLADCRRQAEREGFEPSIPLRV